MRHWLTALLAAMLLFSAPSFASAQQEAVGFSGADYWRAVKDGQAGTTSSLSPEHGVLISVPGELWYEVKTKWVSPLGAIAIFGTLALCALMY
ncbi:MAG: formate dehydrogenase subunit gamma, partial [Aeromonas sp.]